MDQIGSQLERKKTMILALYITAFGDISQYKSESYKKKFIKIEMDHLPLDLCLYA